MALGSIANVERALTNATRNRDASKDLATTADYAARIDQSNLFAEAQTFDGAVIFTSTVENVKEYVSAPVDSGTVIAVGDLIYYDTDDAKPASSLADAGTEAANQEAFHDAFLGIALDASADGETADIRVATKGRFTFTCPSATFEVGALIGASENAGGDALEAQQVEGVATANLAIGRCSSRVNPAATTVTVDVVSTVMYGGPQAMA